MPRVLISTSPSKVIPHPNPAGDTGAGKRDGAASRVVEELLHPGAADEEQMRVKPVYKCGTARDVLDSCVSRKLLKHRVQRLRGRDAKKLLHALTVFPRG